MLTPPIIFSATWILAICLSFIPYFNYYYISNEGFAFYLSGIMIFIISYYVFSIIFNFLFNETVIKNKQFDTCYGHKYLLIATQIGFAILLPVYIYTVINMVGVTGDLTHFFVVVRNMSTAGTLNLPFYISNIPILASFVTIIASVLYGQNKLSVLWLLFSIVLTVIYLSVTGSRASSVTVLGAVFIVVALLKSERSFAYVLIGLLSAVFVMIFSGLIFGRGGSEGEINYTKGLIAFLDYFVNGVILFDNYLLGNADKIFLPNNIFRFVTDTLSSLNIYTKPFDSRYTVFYNFSPHKIGNVYTMYGFIYPVFGGFFTLCFVTVYGLIYALFNKIKKINLYLFVLYSVLLSNLCLSIIKEPVFINLNYMIKLFVFVYVFDKFSKFISNFRDTNRC